MVNRVWLEPGILSVSPPGVEVTTATLGQLLFSLGQGTPSRFITGSVSNSVGGGGSSSTNNVTFPVAFSSPPLVLTQWLQGAGASRPGSTVPQRGLNGQRSPYSDFAFSFTSIDVDVTTTGMSLKMLSASSAFSYTVTWLVFNYRI